MSSLFGGAQERLSFILNLDDRGAVRAFGQLRVSAERNLGEVDNRLDRIAGRMQAGGAAAVGFAAVAGRALFGFAQASEEAEAQQRKLDQAMATAPQLANASRDAFEELADRIQDTTTADGDAVIGLEGLLGTLGMTQDQILELTPLIVDFATRYGLGFDQAARLVNGALDGNAGRLERYIGQIQEGESVTDALARTVGGFAEREAQSLSGQLTILKNNLGDVAEGIGAGVVGAINTGIGPVTRFVDTLADANPHILASAGTIATIGTAGIGAVGGLSLLAGTVLKMRDRFTTLDLDTQVRSINGFGRAAQIAGGVAGIGALIIGLHELSEATTGAQLDMERFSSSTRDDFTGVIEDIGVIFQSSNDAGDDFIDQMLNASVPATERFADAMDDAGLSSDYLRGRIEEKRAADVIATRDQEEYSESITEGGDAARTAAVKLDSYTQAIKDWEDAVDSALGVELSLEEAHLRSQEALETYTETIGDSESSARDREQAGIDLLQTYLDEGDAAREAAENQATAAGRAQTATDEGVAAQMWALGQLANTLAPGSDLRVRLDEYIAQLGRVPRNLNTDITISGNAAGAIKPGTPKAVGGGVNRGTAYPVNEDGTEAYVDSRGNVALIPGSNGEVIPADKVGVAATASVTINNYGLTWPEAAKRMGDDVVWAQR